MADVVEKNMKQKVACLYLLSCRTTLAYTATCCLFCLSVEIKLSANFVLVLKLFLSLSFV